MWGGDFTIQPSKLNLGKAATRRHPCEAPRNALPSERYEGKCARYQYRLSGGGKL